MTTQTKLILGALVVIALASVASLTLTKSGGDNKQKFDKVIQIVPGSGNAPVFALTESGQVAFYTETTDAEGKVQSGWVPILLPE